MFLINDIDARVFYMQPYCENKNVEKNDKNKNGWNCFFVCGQVGNRSTNLCLRSKHAFTTHASFTLLAALYMKRSNTPKCQSASNMQKFIGQVYAAVMSFFVFKKRSFYNPCAAFSFIAQLFS